MSCSRSAAARVLSERLAARVAHLHVVELDRRFEDSSATRYSLHNVGLHFADAVELDLAALDPAPTKVVANLPYGVAATVILRTIDELPSVRSWVVMVQREVGERLAASPGIAAYGAPSVLAQLAAEVRVLRPISRNVFQAGTERRLGAARADARPERGAEPRLRALGSRSVRAPAQGARGLARARVRGSARRPRAGPGRARRARSPRRRARRTALLPRSSASWREGSPREGARLRKGQPVPVPRPGARRRPSSNW